MAQEEKLFMDTVRVGKYLSELRHQHNFSQEELGEKIGVTNKTISRWETGKYLPPVDALQMLSDLYGVTINEILSGKSLSDLEYKELAEENIKDVLSTSTFSLKDKIHFFKKKWKKDHMCSIILGCILIIAIIIGGFIWGHRLYLIGIISGFVFGIVKYNQMMIYVERNAFDGNTESTR